MDISEWHLYEHLTNVVRHYKYKVYYFYIMSYPQELLSQIKAGDNIVKFQELRYGLFSRKYGWIALTEERLIYNARLYDSGSKTKSYETANFPISKITNMRTAQQKIGCFGKQGVLEVNMQGAVYTIIVGKNINSVKPLIQAFNERT